MRKILTCLLEGIVVGVLFGIIDGLSKEAKAGIKRAQKRRAQRYDVLFKNRFDLGDLN